MELSFKKVFAHPKTQIEFLSSLYFLRLLYTISVVQPLAKPPTFAIKASFCTLVTLEFDARRYKEREQELSNTSL